MKESRGKGAATHEESPKQHEHSRATPETNQTPGGSSWLSTHITHPIGVAGYTVHSTRLLCRADRVRTVIVQDWSRCGLLPVATAFPSCGGPFEVAASCSTPLGQPYPVLHEEHLEA